jgi:hypothetical protein
VLTTLWLFHLANRPKVMRQDLVFLAEKRLLIGEGTGEGDSGARVTIGKAKVNALS